MNPGPGPTRRHVLLVEDDPGDAFLVREALRECGAPVELAVARDGEEALAMLRRLPPHADARTPDLILLDLHLPRMDGRQLLAAVKADSALKQIPVVVLSSSEMEQDVRACYAQSVSGYIRKPLDLQALFDAVAALQAFWLRAVVPPPAQ